MSRAARQALALRAAPPRDLHLERRADLLWIETQYLIPDPNQPRTEFDEATLEELGRSIAADGVLVPLRVRPADGANGVHMITDGERRFRAGQRVGVVEFPCMVEGADPDQAFLEAYSTSLHRDALSPVDAAVGMQRIREAFSLASDDEIAEKVKKSLGWVRQMNAVLSLDMETRRELRTRGEPVAIAVGLRAQDPKDRAATLVAIADLPSRDAKVEFISRVNEQRRAGVPIDEAIAAVRAAGAVSAAAAASPSRPAQPGRSVVGRPARITLPFVWRQVGPDWWDVDVHPSVLATTRLAAQRSASVSEWRDAICADLTAFRDASAAAPDGGQAWTGVVEALSALLDTVGAEVS
jgi:ParB/RepB/Spo0J family partition protein